MEYKLIRSGKSILRPRARLINTIGEDLISNDIVAVIELVKNSYDADASIIVIEFSGEVIKHDENKISKNILSREGSEIKVYDDGCGMDHNIIINAWMEPATIMKKQSKNSPGKRRRYTGEKGIGRFAAAKLAAKLKIITRKELENEIIVDLNWDDFSDDSKYLDQVESTWEERSPVELEKSGTILRLIGLKSDWDIEKFIELRLALSRLINPVSPVLDFLIDLQLPNSFEQLSGLISTPETLNKPDYLIKGTIDKNGQPNIFYSSKKREKEENIISFSSKNPKEKYSAGPFSFEFRVWDRDSLQVLASEMGSTLKNVKKDLDDLAGISIYRDKFRVLPYGEKKNDWLRLDIRRVNNPTLRISNNQIVGYISISQDENLDLKDQTNREGIIESDAFSEIKTYVIYILNELEQRRYEERPRGNSNLNENRSLFDDFSIKPIVDLIEKKLSSDKEAIRIVSQTEDKINQGLKKIQEVISRYRRLSTLGLLIDSILHDGNNFLARIDGEIHLIQKKIKYNPSDISQIHKHIDNIMSEKKVLSQLFKRLEPFGGRKRGRPKVLVLEDIIARTFDYFRSDIEEFDIDIILPSTSTSIKIDESDLQIILVNLIQNSLFWLSTVAYKKIIEIIVEKNDNTSVSFIFSDNGPGVKEEYASLIFDPYFSTKPEGIGLGLTIIGELVTEYDGELLLIKNGPQEGASFKIIFNNRI